MPNQTNGKHVTVSTSVTYKKEREEEAWLRDLARGGWRGRHS